MIRAAILALLPCVAFAAPPPGASPDSPTARWFQSLQQPGTGYLCCSVADCRPVAYRAAGDHLEAFIDRRTFGPTAPNAWLRVPPEHVLRGETNPMGEGVVCWYAGEIRCFVEASGV